MSRRLRRRFFLGLRVDGLPSQAEIDSYNAAAKLQVTLVDTIMGQRLFLVISGIKTLMVMDLLMIR